jgi:23S rRNA pseudouridine955/2504/2580 synthase
MMSDSPASIEAANRSGHGVVTAARMVVIESGDAGQRIDNYLLRSLKGVPRSRIYRILRKGEVRVNKGRVTASYRLQSGDQLRIPPIRIAEREGGRVPPAASALLLGRVLYSCKGLMVIDKPAGMAVHGGSGLSHGLIEALRLARTDLSAAELVHRLDRDTSGCLMVATRRSMLRQLHARLRDGEVDKRYLALLAGRLAEERYDVDQPLRKNQLRGGERYVTVDSEGKPARTLFRVVERYREATLVEALLYSGRTHQIRVHAASIGHPVVGDEKYGDERVNQRLAKVGLNRLFLHARGLSFTLDSGEEVVVSAPLPQELEEVLDRL